MSGAPRLPPGFRLVALEQCGSTSGEARRLAEQGAEEGTLVWAREQTAGRGRRGRSWQSPPGNLYFSLVLRPRASLAEAACLGMVAAVAVAEALATLLPPRAQVRLKWPNDVLVEGKKIAGILLESAPAPGDRAQWLILGIGLNIAHYPAAAAFPATSLAAEGAEALAVEPALEALGRSLARWLAIWQSEGFAAARERWLAYAWRKGEMIAVRLEGGTLTGRFADLDASGALWLSLEDGSRRRVNAGEVLEFRLRA